MIAFYKEEDDVLAKHPKTRRFTRAKVIKIEENEYTVEFFNGEKHNVSTPDIKSRSSRSISRSSTRKSLLTYPNRRKSPGRRKKSPARSSVENRKEPLSTIMDSPIILHDSLTVENNGPNYAEVPVKGVIDNSTDTTLQSVKRLRRSARLQPNSPNIENLPLEQLVTSAKKKSNKLNSSKQKVFTFPKNEDKDTNPNNENLSDDTKVRSQEWGGWIGTLFLIPLMPVVALASQISCTNVKCNSSHFQLSTNWKTYINLNSLYAFGAYIAVIAVLSLLPIGSRFKNLDGKLITLRYRINGLLVAALILFAYAGSTYKGYDVSNFILKNIFQLAICGWIYGTLIAIFLYLFASKIPKNYHNPYGSSNKFTYDFWQGKLINPSLGPFDFKIILTRCAVIGSLLINAAVLTTAIKEAIPSNMTSLNIVLLLVIVMQTTCGFDFFLFESMQLMSFGLIKEGTGYMFVVGYLMYPFVSTLQTRFLLYNKTPPNLYVIIPCLIVFVVGYFTYRISNYEKNAFRKNPVLSVVSDLERISADRGKEVIVPEFWGYVRHPNYLGDFMMQWSIAQLSVAPDVIPYFYAITCTIVMIIRAIHDNARCKLYYGAAWDEYCSRVKYAFFKKIV